MPLVEPTLSGKVCLVTGATAGIGKVTAAALAARGAVVVIAGRNPQKTADTAREIQAATGNTVDYLLADFADLRQVRKLAAAFQHKYTRLDVLVNNAGGYFNSRKAAPSGGLEMTFWVNHLAPFLLTNLLLGQMAASGPARIVTVASEAHRFDNMNFADLGFERFYFGFRAYARSKLANILCTYELDRRFAQDGIRANALHPGHVATDIWRTNFPGIGPYLKRFMQLFSLTPEQGADTMIYLASAPEVEDVSGKYFIKRKTVRSSRLSYDPETARRLWEFCEKMTAGTTDSLGESKRTVFNSPS
jgi:NAD(P)-dependent dehydrogenase (short-subunit alcohol dehydrogenase family)